VIIVVVWVGGGYRDNPPPTPGASWVLYAWPVAAQFESIDDYIATFPDDVQKLLGQVRAVLAAALPGATEAISYQIPTLKLHGKAVVHFAAWRKHLSMYPVPSGSLSFEAAVAPYRASKGTVQFPYAEPIPFELIAAIAQARAAEIGRAESGRAR
jgi:uncharacterized protein YdhG (YjbR/CyaY superfamily)